MVHDKQNVSDDMKSNSKYCTTIFKYYLINLLQKLFYIF